MKQWNNRTIEIFFEKSKFEKINFEKKYFGKKENFFQKFSKVRPMWVWPMKQWNNRTIEKFFEK